MRSEAQPAGKRKLRFAGQKHRVIKGLERLRPNHRTETLLCRAAPLVVHAAYAQGVRKFPARRAIPVDMPGSHQHYVGLELLQQLEQPLSRCLVVDVSPRIHEDVESAYGASLLFDWNDTKS